MLIDVSINILYLILIIQMEIIQFIFKDDVLS